jgi:hypothetical protein
MDAFYRFGLFVELDAEAVGGLGLRAAGIWFHHAIPRTLMRRFCSERLGLLDLGLDRRVLESRST